MKELLNFKDKVVLVTGSARGIGLVIAQLFAQRQARVFINDINQVEIDKVVSKLQADGYSAFGVRADVGDFKEVCKMVQEIAGRCGRIDILINNAGLRKMDIENFIENLDESEWDAVMRTNLKGMFNVSKAVIPAMKKQRSGSILNIASQAAIFVPYLSGIHYITSKGSVISFTKGLAKEVGKFNIRVNATIPGFIRDDQPTNRDDAGPYEKILEVVILRRFGSPQDVANLCLFLSSDMASYITGETIAVNGGMPSVLFL